MPLSKYYGGHGEKVMKNMVKEYGKDKGESVFYATANKRKKKDSEKGESKKHERSESKSQEKMETGPSSKLRRKFGV